jgi:flagellar basal-body rod modification protein FlgD
MAPTGTSTSSSSTGSSTASASASAASDQTMFLQLLVAQLENQDPLNPVDGTTFVTQLAEFQQLDTEISTGSDVSSILQDLNGMVAATGANTGDGNTGNNTGAAGANAS